MNISSSTSSAYPSAGAGDSANAIKELEKRKTELQADIQEVYQKDDEAKDKEQKLKELQQEMQKIEMQLQRLQRSESSEAKEGTEPSQMPGDRLEISDKAMLLYKQSKEE